VTPDMMSVSAELLRRGTAVGGVQDVGGLAFAYFSNPDCNRWVIQEIPSRTGKPDGESGPTASGCQSKHFRAAPKREQAICKKVGKATCARFADNDAYVVLDLELSNWRPGYGDVAQQSSPAAVVTQARPVGQPG
jgi:hypothetical protein